MDELRAFLKGRLASADQIEIVLPLMGDPIQSFADAFELKK